MVSDVLSTMPATLALLSRGGGHPNPQVDTFSDHCPGGRLIESSDLRF